MNIFNSLFLLVSDIENWSVDNVISAISVVFVIIGGIFAYRQWRFANRTKRTELIKQIIETLRFDKEIVETMYMIDYDDEWYDKKFHHQGNDLEYKVDKLLSYLSYICYLRKERSISPKEFRVLQYEINRVCTSYPVQSYLWNLYHFSRTQNMECSFQYLIDYGIKFKLINKDTFFDSDINYYIKTLNF